MHAETARVGPSRRLIFGLLLVGVLGAVTAFSRFPGTEDVPTFWLRWAELVASQGLREGYRAAFADYPPGLFFVYALADVLFGTVSPFVLVKGAIIVGLVAGALVYFSWSQSLGWTVALLFALLLNSVALGYMDVLYLGPLFGSLWAMKNGRTVFAGLCFALAVILKWQPLVIAPFFLVQASGLSIERRQTPRVWAGALGRLALGAALPAALSLVLVDPAMIWRAFSLATSHRALSLQALNANWLIELFLYSRQGGAHVYEVTVGAGLVTTMRLFFYAAYGLVFGLFAIKPRRFDEFLWFACVGFLTYFLLNVGVHENHLFVPMVLAFLLPCAGRGESAAVVVFLAAMANVNLLIFYGIEGSPLLQGANMLIASGIFALANCIFVIDCVVGLLKTSMADLREIFRRPSSSLA